MGGIADYSGSRVLQMPIGEACLVAAQRQPASAGVRAASFGSAAGGRTSVVHVALSELAGPAGPVPLAELRARLTSDGRAAWAAYVIGCLGVLYHDGAVSPADGGLAILVASDVPEAAGVSSSAAVEVASMSALLAALGKPPLSPDEKVALLCQKVENEVVGAPCGIMDQLACALGREGRLLSLLCRPATVLGTVPIPPHLRVWGIDSAARRHPAGGAGGRLLSSLLSSRGASRARCATRSAAPTTAPSAPPPSWAAPCCRPPSARGGCSPT